LQVQQQVHDLRLDRHVERRNRFIGDDELRIERQRPGDAMRWRWPPENSWGKRLAMSGVSPTCDEQVLALAARFGPGA
jgi:hypothetical protein